MTDPSRLDPSSSSVGFKFILGMPNAIPSKKDADTKKDSEIKTDEVAAKILPKETTEKSESSWIWPVKWITSAIGSFINRMASLWTFIFGRDNQIDFNSSEFKELIGSFQSRLNPERIDSIQKEIDSLNITKFEDINHWNAIEYQIKETLEQLTDFQKSYHEKNGKEHLDLKALTQKFEELKGSLKIKVTNDENAEGVRSIFLIASEKIQDTLMLTAIDYEEFSLLCRLVRLSENPLDKELLESMEKQLEAQKPTPKPAASASILSPTSGLPNIGNSCYMNSSLQICLASNHFTKVIDERIGLVTFEINELNNPDISKSWMERFFGSNKLAEKQTILVLLKALKEVSDLARNPNPDPSKLKQAVDHLRYQFFISGLGNEIQIHQLNNVQDSGVFLDAIIGQVLGLQISLQSYSEYNHNNESLSDKFSTQDRQDVLKITLTPGELNLQTLINNNFSESINDVANALHKEINGVDVDIFKYNLVKKIAKPEDFFVVHLQRFNPGEDNIHPVKDKREIAWPDNDVIELKSFEEKNKTARYEIKGFVEHQFGDLGGGHYVAYVKDDKGHWWYYSDSFVKRCEENEVPKKNAYMLMMDRIEEKEQVL